MSSSDERGSGSDPENKRAVGRPQDLADVDALEGGSAGKKDRPKR